jgi:nucleoside-diphosphate-sugar epimerase
VSGCVLVTGASGFVGKALATSLAREGRPVRAATRYPAALALGQAAEVMAVPDLTGPVDWMPLLDGVDAVVHLAGIAHVGPNVDPDVYDRVNHVATADLVAACADAGVRRFVFMSSVRAQCGPAASHVLTESDEPQPSEPYGESKLEAESAVQDSGVPWTVLRPVMVYGPGVKGNLARLMRLANAPWPLPFARFAARRSLLSLDNLIAAISFSLIAPAALGEVFLAADPEPVTLPEMLAALRRGAGRRPGLLPMPPALMGAALKLAGRAAVWERLAGDLVVDPGKLIAAGWQPKGDTLDGLAQLARAA